MQVSGTAMTEASEFEFLNLASAEIPEPRVDIVQTCGALHCHRSEASTFGSSFPFRLDASSWLPAETRKLVAQGTIARFLVRLSLR